MSRLSDLLRQVERSDPTLAEDLRAEVKALESRRAFGLNFERHTPETVDLPGRPVRRGDKVRVLPERGQPPASVDRGMWTVASVARTGSGRSATLVRRASPDAEPETAAIDVADLVVVAEFRDSIYPGLVSTGTVERGGDKPFHTVINAENYHALQALLYTHEGKVDAIYIDPPYNTGARDWKYNNDYVDGDDAYRHSKWLAMMERRLKLARRLLNPENSVLIVTIDEKEYLRLGLLLQQVFPDAGVQMTSVTINPKGTARSDSFSRVDEYVFFVFIGGARVPMVHAQGGGDPVRWRYLRRNDLSSMRGTRPRQFYPVYVETQTGRFVKAGVPLGPEDPLDIAPEIASLTKVFPIREDGRHMEWGLTGPSLERAAKQGYVRVTPGPGNQPFTIAYLTAPNIRRVESGDLVVTGTRPDGSNVVVSPAGRASRPTTVWRDKSHDAGSHGTSLLGVLIPDRRFPFPKSLYAVEDTLRFFVANKPNAVILDFFAGSGTTAHAVMRLNKQDGGRRQCISVTNNEVSAEEQTRLRRDGLRPGDPAWEALGICEHITKPRIEAAITGRTPDGEPIKGDYRFTDEFPIADGFEENVEFFTMTYQAPRSIAHHRAFAAVAPLLWLKAGAEGRRIEEPTEDFDIADVYGVLFDLDHTGDFARRLAKSDRVRTAYIVTEDDRGYQTVCAELPEHVTPARLYASYLTNFEINSRIAEESS